MDYVIRSCDLPKKEILMGYIINFWVFWGSKIAFLGNFLKKKFDGSCNQVM